MVEEDGEEEIQTKINVALKNQQHVDLKKPGAWICLKLNRSVDGTVFVGISQNMFLKKIFHHSTRILSVLGRTSKNMFSNILYV